MSLSSEPPLTRRAAREFARATGEQPAIPGSTLAAPVIPVDDTGQPLTRRRIRELREAGVMVDTSALVIAEVTAPSPHVEAPPVSEAAVEAPVMETVVVEAPPAASETGPAATETTRPQPEAVVSSEAAPSSAEPRSEWTAPEGHWTRQLEDEDPEAELEGTYSREVGAATPTTSALIIPDVPAAMDLGGPLDSTGEILLTGSIPLSPSLATTGSIDRLADAAADGDDRFDDRRLHETAQDGQPVRASAVASQHALGTPIVSDGKGRGHRGLTVLLIAASALAVVVTGLVIAAIALKLI